MYMGTVKLNGKEKKLLSKALCDAFISPFEFQKLIRYNLSQIFQSVTNSNNLEEVAFHLIEKADSHGAVEELMKGALESNSGNPQLKFAVAAITLKHILKPFEQKYLRQMQDSYFACCSEIFQEKYNNEHSVPDSLEKLFDELLELEELDRLAKFAAYFYVKVEITNFTDLKEWGEKITEKFSDFLTQIENDNNKHKIDKEELYKHLLPLNFFEQVKLFREFVEGYSVGGYIIYGEQGYGQEWLLKRLVLLITKGQPAKNISIGLHINTYSSSSERIWHELSREYGITGTKVRPGKNKSIEIIHAMRKNLETQSVILIFKEVNDLGKIWIHEFIKEVWKPLSKEVSYFYNCSHPHKLLLFVVDLKGSVEQWKIPYENNDESYLIRKLPKIQKISCEILSNWIQNKIDILPRGLIDKIETNVKEILAHKCKDGEPMSVLEYICEEWGHDWLELENIWLKY